MKFHRIARLIAALGVLALTLSPAVASAGACTFSATPNQGWPGATITFKGFQMSPNTQYYVNYDGNQIRMAMTNGNGAFSFNYTLSGSEDTPGTHNWFVFADSGCGMNDARDFVVLASEPTTTTTTIPETTTTTVAATTTTAAPTTTVAGDTTTSEVVTTTTAAGATTTTVLAGGETTTTVAGSESGGGGGIPIYIWGIIAVLVAIILLFVGRSMGGRRK